MDVTSTDEFRGDAVAELIARYFEQNPSAQGALLGITEWWVTNYRRKHTRRRGGPTRRLLAEGRIVEIFKPGRERYYRIKEDRVDTPGDG